MPRGALSVARRLPPLETVFRGRGICSRVQGCHLRKYMHIHTKYMQIHHIHTYTCIYIHIHTLTWAGLLYMQIHTYTCRYMHIHSYTCIYIIYIHIQASVNYCQEVFLRGGNLRLRASGRIPTDQTCCDRPWGWIVVCGSCTGDRSEEREGGSRGPGRVPRGGVRQI